MANTIKLGYWGIRAKAQIPRLLLAYTGAQWENVAYSDPAKWFGDDKLNLGLDFPNLPYLIDGDVKISESSAIERYIIARSGNTELLGKTLHDSAKVNEIIGVLEDIRTAVAKLFNDKEYETKLKEAWEKVKPKLDNLQKFVGNKDWYLGYLTLADFGIAELSYYVEKLFPEEFKTYSAVLRIRSNFDNLPQVKEYYTKPEAIKGPFLPQSFVVKL